MSKHLYLKDEYFEMQEKIAEQNFKANLELLDEMEKEYLASHKDAPVETTEQTK